MEYLLMNIDKQLRNRDNPELIESEIWSCLNCTLKERANYIPFLFLSSDELFNMNSLDSMKLLELLPDNDIVTEALNTNYIVTNDLD